MGRNALKGPGQSPHSPLRRVSHLRQTFPATRKNIVDAVLSAGVKEPDISDEKLAGVSVLTVFKSDSELLVPEIVVYYEDVLDILLAERGSSGSLTSVVKCSWNSNFDEFVMVEFL
ncbi:hypothetical protein AVEN_33920-1 [Araneus ventricosus]|uniref:Uncharacterized protein n=1 Tax=Araneus ventricosus TaxID=182803 RepID=A0A4Y2TK84_ARAVE|nr:hypothetical protein AVEN_85320-1 [Araneus ventricosus]GBO01009.1 hypothetical protein AVEN_33920-1 [Araneus ventricosus]